MFYIQFLRWVFNTYRNLNINISDGEKKRIFNVLFKNLYKFFCVSNRTHPEILSARSLENYYRNRNAYIISREGQFVIAYRKHNIIVYGYMLHASFPLAYILLYTHVREYNLHYLYNAV